MFIKNMFRYCIPTIVSAIVAVMVLPLISRMYPEDEYGYINNFYTIGNMLMGIVFLGLDSAYIRYFNEPPEGASRNGLFFFALKVGIVVTVCGFTFVLLFTPAQASGLLFNENGVIGLTFLGVYVIELVFFRLLNINFRFSEQARAYNIQQISFTVCNRCLFLLAVIYTTRYIFSVGIIVAGMLGIVLISLWIQRFVFDDVKINVMVKKEMLLFAIPVMPATIITMLNNTIANLFLGGFGLRSEAGRLAIAMSLSNIFAVIPNAFSVYWGPFMYKYYHQEQERIKNIHDMIMMFSMLMLICIIIFQDVLYMLLGKSYRTSQSYFLIIMLVPISNIIAETTTYGIGIAKKTKYMLLAAMVGCLINIIACCLFIPRLGACGAAIGIALSATITFMLKSIIGQHFYSSVRNRTKSILSMLLIWIVCISNSFLYKKLPLRIMLCLVIAGTAIFLYWSYIEKIIAYLKRFNKG